MATIAAEVRFKHQGKVHFTTTKDLRALIKVTRKHNIVTERR